MGMGNEMDVRAQMLRTIGRNIATHGFHIYSIRGGLNPDFAYTIGLTESVGYEIVLAGASLYSADEVGVIVNTFGNRLRSGVRPTGTHGLSGLGSFRFQDAHKSWMRSLLLGARDYYGRDVRALQVMPDHAHRSVDTPDMRVPLRGSSELAWSNFLGVLPRSVPESAEAAINVAALRGARVTEASRRADGYWEVYAGDPFAVPPADMRIVPLGTILAADPTLGRALTLSVGATIRRDDSAGEWRLVGAA